MLELLPPFLREYSELKAIMNVESSEIESIKNTHNQIIDNRYIQTCDETGISRFEKLLGIAPLSNDTLDDRKVRCLTKWNHKLPYNYVVLLNSLSSVCGADGYAVSMDFTGLQMAVRIALSARSQLSSVKKMIERMVPCTVSVSVEMMYNTNAMLSPFTHMQLETFTHAQLREDNL